MVNHQYLNDQPLAYEVRTGMCEVLTKSGLSFMYKMIREIISVPREDSGYPIILCSIPGFSRMTSSKLIQKTNSRHHVSALCQKSALGMESTCTESALSTFVNVNTHTTHTYTHTLTHPHPHTHSVNLTLLFTY